MSSSKDLNAAIKRLKVLNFSPKLELKEFRERIDDTFSSVFLPNRVEAVQRDFYGIPGYQLNPEAYASNRILLYIHGGAFAGGSAKAYLPFAASLAHASASRTIVPDFRLPPSHSYPAGLDDLKELYRTIYSEEVVTQSLNEESNDARPEIIIAADDSGASLAMALIMSLKGRWRDCIRQLILFSPILNISDSNPLFTDKKAKDDIYTGEGLRRCAELYTFADNRTKPFVSPVFVTPDLLDNFPPVFIQAGEKEYMLDDDICFQQILKAAGVECELDVWPGMVHMFQFADEQLSEAHLAVEKAGHMLTKRTVQKTDSVRTVSLKLEKSSFSDNMTEEL